MSHVEIIAHRGASADAPENTLAAIQLAWQQEADAAEIDVQLTTDGQLVAIHDDTMLRTGGVDWVVNDRTLAELKSLDVGSWKSPPFANERIPTLAEALDIIPLGKRLFIEVKCGADAIPELIRVLSAAKATREQTVLISLDFDTIVAVKRALPDRIACWVTEQFVADSARQASIAPPTSELIDQALAAKLDGLDINNLTERPPGDIGQITRAGLQAYVWTVNTAERAAWHQAEGIHGITTDVPERLRAMWK
jgi:glycerophosphoryl diester phosphodiesterase